MHTPNNQLPEKNTSHKLIQTYRNPTKAEHKANQDRLDWLRSYDSGMDFLQSKTFKRYLKREKLFFYEALLLWQDVDPTIFSGRSIESIDIKLGQAVRPIANLIREAINNGTLKYTLESEYKNSPDHMVTMKEFLVTDLVKFAESIDERPNFLFPSKIKYENMKKEAFKEMIHIDSHELSDSFEETNETPIFENQFSSGTERWAFKELSLLMEKHREILIKNPSITWEKFVYETPEINKFIEDYQKNSCFAHGQPSETTLKNKVRAVAKKYNIPRQGGRPLKKA